MPVPPPIRCMVAASLTLAVPGQVKKAAPPSIKKATGSKRTGGWLGGAGGAQDLDKWYGEQAQRCARQFTR